MKTEDCNRYLQDPEANASHLESCKECRALFAPPDGPGRSIALPALPMAGWEGARHRAWALVAIAALLVIGGALILSTAAGLSPFGVLRSSLTGGLPSLDVAGATLFRIGSALQHVPIGWQIGIGIAFVVVNSALIALLRRAPRGLDV